MVNKRSGAAMAKYLFFILIFLACAVYAVFVLLDKRIQQDANLIETPAQPKFDDYDEGVGYARENNLPVLIDFSGYGCANARKMEAFIWTDPQVKNTLEQDYVLISLMVDDKRKLPETVEVEEYGEERLLRTYGDKWAHLQRSKFSVSSQPYYVVLDREENAMGLSCGYTEDVNAFLKFLNVGLTNFKKDKVEE